MGTLPSVGLPNVSIAGQMSPISAIETAALSDEPVVSRAARRRGSVSPRFDVDVDIDKIAVTLTTDMVKHLAVIQSKFVRVSRTSVRSELSRRFIRRRLL